MSNTVLKSIIRLRRDNDYNYAKIENTFIPASGEVCLVDTATKGLRAKVGDGSTVFKNLEYSDAEIYDEIENVLVKGYMYEGNFYKEVTHSTLITPISFKIYVDLQENVTYVYDNDTYISIGKSCENATSEKAGIMKLYNTTGENTDGTMTQKAITDELNDKFEMKIDSTDVEMLVFDHNL